MGRVKNFKIIILAAILILPAIRSFAEEEIPFELNNAVQEDSSYESTVVEPAKPKKDTQKAQVPQPGGKSAPQADLAGLGSLAPFSDIAVISKRFLPKTNRFEFFVNGGVILNDAFFSDFVYGGRLGYYFTEKYGLEAIGTFISSSSKTVTTELQNERNVATQALATPTAYYGGDFKWVPVYGKIGWMNKSIIPFDFYFSVGGGITTTNQNTSPPTAHIGAGQMFALNKSMAVRLDVSWYGYQSTTKVGATGATGATGTYSNLHATLGMCFFFPGAEYR